MRIIAQLSIITLFVAIGAFVLLAPLDLLIDVIIIVVRLVSAMLISAFGFYLAGYKKS